MDKLINYLDFRAEKYGVTTGIASANSMYYKVGCHKIRVSDHMKYSADALAGSDFYFIIQPDDNYIFITNPKYNKDGKMYMKIVTYQEAKDFIKSLDDMAIQFMKMTNWYIPEDWNKGDSDDTKPTWDEFFTAYIDGKEDSIKVSIINRIENMVYGSIKKGNFEDKLSSGLASEAYTKLSKAQFNTLVSKL